MEVPMDEFIRLKRIEHAAKSMVRIIPYTYDECRIGNLVTDMEFALVGDELIMSDNLPEPDYEAPGQVPASRPSAPQLRRRDASKKLTATAASLERAITLNFGYIDKAEEYLALAATAKKVGVEYRALYAEWAAYHLNADPSLADLAARTADLNQRLAVANDAVAAHYRRTTHDRIGQCFAAIDGYNAQLTSVREEIARREVADVKANL